MQPNKKDFLFATPDLILVAFIALFAGFIFVLSSLDDGISSLPVIKQAQFEPTAELFNAVDTTSTSTTELTTTTTSTVPQTTVVEEPIVVETVPITTTPVTTVATTTVITAPIVAYTPQLTSSAIQAPDIQSICQEFDSYRIEYGLPVEFTQIAYEVSGCVQDEFQRTACCVSWLGLSVGQDLEDPLLEESYKACNIPNESFVNSNTEEDKHRTMCIASAIYTIYGLSYWI